MKHLTPISKMLMVYIAIIGLLIMCNACSSSKKLDKAKQTMLANQDELARLCAKTFPAVERIVYKEGKIIRDTLIELQDLLIPVDCPASKKDTVIKWQVQFKDRIIKENKVDTVEKEIESGPVIAALKADVQDCKAENEELKSENETLKKYRNWFIYFVIGLIVGLAIWIYIKGPVSIINKILRK